MLKLSYDRFYTRAASMRPRGIPAENAVEHPGHLFGAGVASMRPRGIPAEN